MPHEMRLWFVSKPPNLLQQIHPLKSSDPLAKNNKTSPRPRKSWFSVSTKCCICSSAFSEYLPLSQSDNAKIARGWWMPRCMKQRRLRQPRCRIPIMSPDLPGKQLFQKWQCNCLWKWKATKIEKHPWYFFPPPLQWNKSPSIQDCSGVFKCIAKKSSVASSIASRTRLSHWSFCRCRCRWCLWCRS